MIIPEDEWFYDRITQLIADGFLFDDGKVVHLTKKGQQLVKIDPNQIDFLRFVDGNACSPTWARLND